MEPLTKGRYPDIMRQIVGSRLPNFTEEERNSLLVHMIFLVSTITSLNTPSQNLTHILQRHTAMMDAGVKLTCTCLLPRSYNLFIYI